MRAAGASSAAGVCSPRCPRVGRWARELKSCSNQESGARGAHSKGPCCEKTIFPQAAKEQKSSSRLPRLLPSFACRLQPQGCHSCVLSLWKLNARVNGVSPERGARRGRARGPSRASSHGRLCSPPGASPEHPPHLPSHCPHLSIPSSFPDFSGLLPWQSLASIGSL